MRENTYNGVGVLNHYMVGIYSVSLFKEIAHSKTYFIIFTQSEYISVKFLQFVASLYPHVLSSFGQFINIMALVSYLFYSFLCQQVKVP